MPQISSIIKNRDDTTNVNSSFPKDDGLSEGLDHPIKAGSLLTLSIDAGFPMVDIPRTYGAAYHRRTNNGNEKYSLGTGVSCSVHRFTLDHVINSSFPAGDVVALKHYSSRGDDYSVKNIRKWLWNELKVFRHPYLRAQENICQLRVIGWEEDNLVPLLGLELAQYGTLADCLQDIRSYSTDMRKAHIMLDIALGLQAIHSVKLVHGDLKPANIIVCVHHDDSRKIIAKLSDFGGVSPADTYEHEFGTTLWEAPEVLLKEATINWQLADVYSFGMVLATLWSPKGWIPPGGSFMDPHIVFELKDSDKARVLEGLKFNPDHDPRSLLKTALEGHDEDGSPLLSLVSEVFRGSLPTLPECRKTMPQLLKYFKPFAESTGRVIDSPPHPRDIDPSHWIDASAEISVVLNAWFMARPSSFKKAMFQAIRSEALALDRSVTVSPVSDIERDFEGDAEDLAERLREDSRRLNRSLNTKLIEFASCAFDVAICYLVGMGTLVDEAQALHWLGRAALAGECNSILYYSPIEESFGSRSQVVLPRKLWCAYGLRAGITANAPPLEELDPDLYSRAQYLRQNSYTRRIIPRGRQTQSYLTSLMESIRQDATIVDQETRDSHGVGGQSALHLCAAAGVMEHVRFLVTAANADINVRNGDQETPIFVAVRAGQYEVVQFLMTSKADVALVNTKGVSILHALADMEDQYAAKFVDAFVHQGAPIDLVAKQEPTRFDNHTTGIGTPLFWAALKSKKLLFNALLNCHAQPEFHITSFDFVVLLRLLSLLHLHELLALALDQ